MGEKVEKGEIVEAPKAPRMTIKAKLAKTIATVVDIKRFEGGLYRKSELGYVPMNSDEFATIAYQTLGVIDKSRIADLYHFFEHASEDVSHLSKYIAIGDRVWDRNLCDWTTKVGPDDCIYRTAVPATHGEKFGKYLLDLADGDAGVAKDIIQAIAPIFMTVKPTGIVFFVGNGQVGKSGIVEAIYRIIGTYLEDLSLEQIEDERDTPALNGKIANVLSDSSTTTTVVNDKNYKLMGDHKSFKVHTFHTQSPTKINGNLHYIFNTNQIPNFSSKDNGVRRRTLLIKFVRTFPVNEMFYERTFTKVFLSDLLGAILTSAKDMKKRGYRYDWSETTLAAKAEYDDEANSAETYIREILRQGIIRFDSHKNLEDDYEWWCKENGYYKLPQKTLVNATKNAGYIRQSFRLETGVKKSYILANRNVSETEHIPLRTGLYKDKNVSAEVEIKNDKYEEIQLELDELLKMID
jgi:phage/plasmid-associated DNA primase